MKIISGSIDVTKIDKSRLYKGKKGTYLKVSIFLKDQPDQYDNDGFIKEEPTKEERERGVNTTILGNVKVVFDNNPTPQEDPTPQPGDIEFDDDLPF